MPYDEDLAERIRAALRDRLDVEEKKLFGGLGFLLAGNLCVGVWKDSLIARVGPDAYAKALESPYAREFDVTGRPMRGWVLVEPEGFENAAALQSWVESGVQFAATLPAK